MDFTEERQVSLGEDFVVEEVFDMWIWRTKKRIKQIYRVNNEEVSLNRAKKNRTLSYTIQKRNVDCEGKVERERERGRIRLR